MNVLRPIQKEFYGDDYRWFFGTVVNANPPAGLEGRVKVRINGVHSPITNDIPERDLPWAQVLIPTTEGGSSGIGRIPQIVSGAMVFGVFLDGVSSQLPLILGSLPRVEYPSGIQRGRVISGNNAVDYNQKRLLNITVERLSEDEDQYGTLSLRRQQCLKFFIDNGYSLLHASAITGAIEGISSFTIFKETDNPNQGIVNWEKSVSGASRYSQLISFASRTSPSADWKVFSIQLQFVLFELRNRFSGANRKLLATQDLSESSKVVNRDYLNSFNDTESLAQIAYDGALV